jgi:hypothetical protein
MDLKKISLALGIIMTLGAIVGAAWQYDKCKADQCDLELIAKRLDQKIMWDKIDRIQARIWDLERHYGGIGVPSAPQPVKDEYRFLLQEIERMKRDMKP